MITAKRLTYIMYATLALSVISGVVLTVYTNSWLTSKAQSLVVVKLETAALEEKQRVNQKAASELEKYESTRETLDKIVPKSKDQAKAIGEILTIANEVNVNINTISFPASELGTSVVKSVPGTTPTTSAAASTVTQAKAVENIPGLLGIEVTLSQIDRKGGAPGSGMTYSQLLDFLRSLEKNRRTMQIKTIQVQPLKVTGSSTINGYSLTLTMNIFVKP